MTTTRVGVRAATPYDVVIGRGLLPELPGLLGDDVARVAVIAAAPLGEFADRVRSELGDYEVLDLSVPEGERAKTAEVAITAWDALGGAGFTRSDAVVSVGGGATTDLAGFVAATWLRGVRVVHVPTTLLGMVDAAVGGKTGMNTSTGKNLVGAFHEPAGVLCDLDLLDSLPRAELVAGAAEVLKCGFIADPEILALIERHGPTALDADGAVLAELVERAVRVKADVVSADLRERGGVDGHPGREALNYGHTLAHALEKRSGYRLRHGEAVALGMIYAAELGRLSGRTDAALAERHHAVLAAIGLPVRLSAELAGGWEFAELAATMAVDKKARGARLRFIVLDELARPGVLSDPDPAWLRAAYDAVRAPVDGEEPGQ